MTYFNASFLLMAACAVFFYRAGDYEDAPGWLWCALSIGISAVVWLWLRGGFIALALSQVGLFVAITGYRVWRDKR